MRNAGGRGLRLPVIVVGVAVVAGIGVAAGHRLDPTRRVGARSFCDPALPTAVVGAAVPPFTATDQDGHTVTERALRGTPWIADFIFTSCTASCPILTARLLTLQRRLSGAPVRFVSFSVDPEHDSPPVMKAYARRWQGDAARWRLLSVDRDALARLGAALGGAEDPAAQAAPFHSDRFALVDAGGRMLGLYSSSSDSELEQLQRDLQAALASADTPADRTIAVRPAGAAPL